MVKKTCQALESLNYDFRDRSYAQITRLGQDEHEKDTKNRTSTNSASELLNILEMVRKTCQALESLNSDVQDIGHIWVVNRHKKSDCKEFSL